MIPLGEVDFFQVNKLTANLSALFSVPSDVLQGMKLPKEAYNVARNQYFAAVILHKLELLRANQREVIVGILEEDIYNATGAYVFSSADRLANCAVISYFRARQEFYGLPEDERLIYRRIYKESAKQVGRILGLKACRNPKCIMFSSEDMYEVDSKGEKLCDICQRQYLKIR